MNTSPLTYLFVQEQLNKFYAGHKKLNDGIIDEIVSVFNKRNLLCDDFVSAIVRYREAMSASGKHNFTPTAWDLLKFTRRAKKDREHKFVMGVPTWDERSLIANRFYERAELVLYAQYGIDNFCGMEGGWDRNHWDAFMERALKHDIEKGERQEKNRENNTDMRRYFANVCNRLAGKNLISVPPPDQITNAGLGSKKSLYQQRQELNQAGSVHGDE